MRRKEEPDKVSVLGEDLHPRPLVASIANHKLARAFHHRNLEGKRDWKSFGMLPRSFSLHE